MELLTILVTAAKDMNFCTIKPPENILNVSMKDYFYAYYLILTGKSIVAGYALVFLVPLWITLAAIFASILKGNLQELDNVLFDISSKGEVATVVHSKKEIVDISSWIFSQWDTSFQLFLDIYFSIIAMLLFIKIFGKEYEKAFTLICIILCLDWYIDHYQGQSPLNIPEMVVTFMFLGFSLLTLRPSRISSNLSYFYICALLMIWMNYKYYKIVAEHGISESPSRNWKVKLLSMMKSSQIFLNVSTKDSFYTYYLILTGKSIVAGYASVFIVPLWKTLATFLASNVKVYLQELDNAYFHIVSKGLIATVLYWNPRNEVFAIPAWIFLQCDTSFELFLDIYFIITYFSL